MTGMTLTEKVFARSVGRTEIHAGEIVFPEPDLVVNIDSSFPMFIQELRAAGATKVARADKVIVVADHDTPNLNVLMAQRSAQVREMCKEYDLRLFDVGRAGNSHILPAEKGLVGPGMLVFSMDTHSGNLGAIGAVAPCVLYEMSSVLTTGTLWMKVPETIRITLTGELSPDVRIRDVADYVIAQVGAEVGDYRVLEFVGDFVESLNVDNRMVLCNRGIEIGAKASVIPPDDIARQYVAERGGELAFAETSDPDAVYVAEYAFDVSTLEPQVALPPSPDNVHPLSTVVGTKINQALIQGCSSGTIDELQQAADVLRGRTVHPSVRMFVVPMTQEIYTRATALGLLEVFASAGATVMAPSCQSCYGMSTPLSDGDVCISTSPRNDPGRMGSREATILLAGPRTVASAAVAGEIIHPSSLENLS